MTRHNDLVGCSGRGHIDLVGRGRGKHCASQAQRLQRAVMRQLDPARIGERSRYRKIAGELQLAAIVEISDDLILRPKKRPRMDDIARPDARIRHLTPVGQIAEPFAVIENLASAVDDVATPDAAASIVKNSPAVAQHITPP